MAATELPVPKKRRQVTYNFSAESERSYFVVESHAPARLGEGRRGHTGEDKRQGGERAGKQASEID